MAAGTHPAVRRALRTVDFPVTVTNRGNTPLSVRVGELDVPDGVSVEYEPPEFDLAPWSSGICRTRVSAPRRLIGGNQDHVVDLRITARATTPGRPLMESEIGQETRVTFRQRPLLSPGTLLALALITVAALWLAGFEDDAEQLQCGELCVFEIFGKDLGPVEEASAEVGVGVKAFRDPALTQDFSAPRLPIDVVEPHLYAVEWDDVEAVFSVDGSVLRRCPRPPTYPMQLMIAVFDFPDWSTGDDADLVPRLVVDRVAGDRPSAMA
jgi:hypothetical protein